MYFAFTGMMTAVIIVSQEAGKTPKKTVVVIEISSNTRRVAKLESVEGNKLTSKKI